MREVSSPAILTSLPSCRVLNPCVTTFALSFADSTNSIIVRSTISSPVLISVKCAILFSRASFIASSSVIDFIVVCPLSVCPKIPMDEDYSF